ncbi:MAG: hypothetical protein QOD86_597 [Miltoncostaeaceae bacterium]|jgi:hypothetical protein|nr:hypothetical protein [Miltoncostaeaceae bacterium]
MMAAAAGAGILAAAVFGFAAVPANAQASDVKVTAQQLLVNQRISQAGVRRANEALQKLAELAVTPGPQGPAGPKGDTGPAGPAGAPGAPGASGGLDTDAVSIESKNETIPADTTSAQIDVMCPTGTVAVSGGLQTTDDNGFGELVSSWQSAAGTWSFVMRNDASSGGDDLGMTFSAVCLAVTPESTP